ncbi:MAG: hypothetical protein ACOC6Q_01910 [Patescibacteria group bacterium]
MPRFLSFIIFLNSVSWLSSIYIFLRIPPRNNYIVLLLLTSVVFSLQLTFSLVLYFFRLYTTPEWYQPRTAFRDAFKISLPVSVLVFVYLLFRFLGIISIKVLVMLLAVFAFCEYWVLRNL